MIDKGMRAGWNNPPIVREITRCAGPLLPENLILTKLSYLMDIAADLNFLLSEPLPG
jgi:hypothetical protein